MPVPEPSLTEVLGLLADPEKYEAALREAFTRERLSGTSIALAREALDSIDQSKDYGAGYYAGVARDAIRKRIEKVSS